MRILLSRVCLLDSQNAYRVTCCCCCEFVQKIVCPKLTLHLSSPPLQISVYMHNMKCGGDETDAGEGILGCLRVVNWSCSVENFVLHIYCICNSACHSSWKSCIPQGVDPIPARMHTLGGEQYILKCVNVNSILTEEVVR